MEFGTEFSCFSVLLCGAVVMRWGVFLCCHMPCAADQFLRSHDERERKFSINGCLVLGGVKIPTRDAVDGSVRCLESG